MVQMCLHGALADAEAVSDVGVTESLKHETDDLHLARGELCGEVAYGRFATEYVRDYPDQRSPFDPLLARVHLADRTNQELGRHVLEDQPGNAKPHRFR